jgi:predicted MPP superfamily phosphohydrolase
MNRTLFITLAIVVTLLLDYYAFQAVRVVTADTNTTVQKYVKWVYWGFTAVVITLLLSFLFLKIEKLPSGFRNVLISFVFTGLITKLVMVVFLFVDDIIRGSQYLIDIVYQKISPPKNTPQTFLETAKDYGRSEFLAKSGIITATLPLITVGYGIISGAHDYRIHRQKVVIPRLPSAFNGIKIAQLSDIHSGSFFNKTAVKGGVEMLLKEKPDMVFFTGDLVNNTADEVKDYIDIFNKVTAPLGVYAILGNHDYGDYVQWKSLKEKQANLKNLLEAHRLLGWKLLLDENVKITQSGEQIALLGVQNWGAKGRFPKYGNLAQAYKGTEETPVKILLSHDPSHWDAQIIPQFKDIDLTLSGHTHGMQFGVEIGNFKWSPVQYMYPQWAGLYQQNLQYLYVNRGFGYIGFPGRIGILPEITILELVKA